MDDNKVIEYLLDLGSNTDVHITGSVDVGYCFESILEVAYIILQKADTRSDTYHRAQEFVDGYKHFKDYLKDKGLY